MRKFFLAASGVFAAIPGTAVIFKGVGAPPNYQYLFGGIIEAFGTLGLIVLFINKNKLRRTKTQKITKAAISLGILSFVSLIVYMAIFQHCVVSHPTHGTVYFPLWTDGRIARYVERTGGRWQALDEYGFYAIESAIREMTFLARPLTTAVLLFTYQTVFTSLTLAFSIIGFHKGHEITQTHIGDRSKRT
jgi:hypothetical protein